MFWIKKKDNISEIISNAVGPAPWYWDTFPNIKSDSENYTWNSTGTTGEHSYLVTLGLETNKDKIKLVLNTYSRALYISSNHLGICFSKGGNINLSCFDLKQLPFFNLKDLPHGFKENKENYFSLGKPVSQIIVSQSLKAGEYGIAIPKEFKPTDEIIIVDSYDGEKDLAYAIYLINPDTETVKILPQKWFTSEAGFDLGYQWITRVTRGPYSKKLFGDGIRIGTFELTEDGCNLARWIKRKV